MKAIVSTQYGPPDVLELQEVPKPTPKENEVLIRVYASTVAAGDVRMRSFNWARWFWLPGKIMFGFRRPRRSTPGNELAGEIEIVGRNVTKFKPGDKVFGIVWEVSNGGGNAEYKCMPENRVAMKPRNMSFEEAAAVPIGGLTALILLKKGKIQEGQKVLIYGASGSVGTFAIQLAKYFGAEVTGVCSTANVEMVKSIGAENVIDYKKDDFSKKGEKYDIIFDTVMKTSFSRCKSSLTRKGTFITVDWPFIEALWTSITSTKKITYGIASNIEDLIFLRELIEKGKIKAVIDRCYSLAKTADAHRYVDKGHKKGNVVITIAK